MYKLINKKTESISPKSIKIKIFFFVKKRLYLLIGHSNGRTCDGGTWHISGGVGKVEGRGEGGHGHDQLVDGGA